ncbi:hypothetical protein B9479_000645 [Cryptococcus floricola]|uniref:SCP domain-containing protein n=1 Tax=Cryptococcus floricola TaxID=2591691 RepID=A0A5D3B6Y8_9TREE|nr:hypothetical protein B9479_000645 [Cryptococcus floricola]
MALEEFLEGRFRSEGMRTYLGNILTYIDVFVALCLPPKEKHFVILTHPSNSDYDASNPQASHFTQVVWKSSTKLGWAQTSCADGTIFTGYGDSPFIVCEYDPAGNVAGQYGDDVQV